LGFALATRGEPREAIDAYRRAAALAPGDYEVWYNLGNTYLDSARFEEVLKDPIGLIDRIYKHFEMDFSDEARERMETFLRENPRHKHGSHKYTLEDFGLDAERDGKYFEEYCDLFKIRGNKA
ncbi:MAG: tetratricopeptide repeat protein, partial [Deltaproteobacteria bacterium]|nr:tetratricopeptide repeat protein [Deltaproteobacteria bacterium]